MSIACSNCGHTNASAKPGDLCEVCNHALGSTRYPIASQDWLWKLRTFGLQSCEGTVIHVKELRDPEDPDPDIPALLARTLLFLDVFLVLGSLGLIFLGFGLAFIIIGLIFSIGCILPIVAVMSQVFLYAFIRTLLSTLGKKPEKVSVTNYEILAQNGNTIYVKLKGNLQGAWPKENDRVIFWGRHNKSILQFRCGLNTVSGVSYLLPDNFSTIGLGILVFLNLVSGVWLLISMASAHGS